MAIPGDVVAIVDQMAQAARESARPIAAFYAVLRDAGVDEETCNDLTVMYADRILLGRGIGA